MASIPRDWRSLLLGLAVLCELQRSQVAGSETMAPKNAHLAGNCGYLFGRVRQEPLLRAGGIARGGRKKYAILKGYEAKVLDVSGDNAGPRSKQTQEALKWFRQDNSVAAFYGFSGGGYNLLHILCCAWRTEVPTVKVLSG
jgi:hypothetical protein